MSREEIIATARRPPLDPYPEPHPSEEGGDEKAYPPELGTDAIAVLEGRTFLLSDALGTCLAPWAASFTTTRASSTGGKYVSRGNRCRSSSLERSTTTRRRSI